MDLYEASRFALADGQILDSLERPLFNLQRLAKDRLLWMFPREKDLRVGSLLRWIQSVENGLAAFALDRFLEFYERGALIANAATFSIHSPLFDYLTYEDSTATRDKRLQESIGFYDPVEYAYVFVLLPSPSGNSAAIWRQRVRVPESSRSAYHRAVRASPKVAEEKKTVVVDEILCVFHRYRLDPDPHVLA
ncbi:hypothetical protein K488DRAFT_42884 [Vararia minispora EC-137]|uniref:Uncharacterized protein n=1 Tax=Vararia minispora EC-137 TaxID=1314806 RepID=A0ACB8QW58_9AGAM|nr:hypothetical protein K488DRAFT_42884 [Vararia minispora EC-137]